MASAQHSLVPMSSPSPPSPPSPSTLTSSPPPSTALFWQTPSFSAESIVAASVSWLPPSLAGTGDTPFPIGASSGTALSSPSAGCTPFCSFSSVSSFAGDTDGFLTGDAFPSEVFLVGELFPSEVFLVGGGFAALAAALAAATLLAAALGFTGLRPGTAPLSTVEEVGRADVAPTLLLVVVVVVAALPPPAVVEVTVVVELFGFVVLATLGRDTEGTFGTVPVLEPSVGGFTADLAAVVDP